MLNRRLDSIESARGRPVHEIDEDYSLMQLEDKFAAEVDRNLSPQTDHGRHLSPAGGAGSTAMALSPMEIRCVALGRRVDGCRRTVGCGGTR